MACLEDEDRDDQEPPNYEIPDIPATYLRYTTINKISMKLCIAGTISNWKNVACKLGFSNEEINGKYANFDGCDPAENMLNDWVIKRGGKIPQLVKVFKGLQLISCLEDLLNDEGYKAILNYFKHDANGSDNNDNDDDGCSSGTGSIEHVHSLPYSTNTDTTLSSLTSSSLTSQASQSLTSGKPSLDYPSLPDPTPFQDKTSKADEKKTLHAKTVPQKKNNEKLVTKMDTACSVSEPDVSSGSQKPANESPLITWGDWPKPDYTRSISENAVEALKTKPAKKSFFRTLSSDSGSKKKEKENRESKDKKHSKRKHIWLKITRKARSKKQTAAESSQVVHVKGHYAQGPLKESTNLSPLRECDIPESIDREVANGRPVSSGSEDSLPYSPSSPNSLGYESGTEFEVSDNQSKNIYIVCNPAEPTVFSKAYELYLCFSKKGYQCTMFAMDFNEVLEIGYYRYSLEQVNKADYLFLCVSEQLKKIFEGPNKEVKKLYDDNSKGLRHVSDFMMSFLAMECCNKNGKFMPILLDEDSYQHIPLFLGNYFSYKWPEQETKMENIIHKRPEFQIRVSTSRIQGTQKVFGLKTSTTPVSSSESKCIKT